MVGIGLSTWIRERLTERQGRILEAFSKLAETSRRRTGSAIRDAGGDGTAEKGVGGVGRARSGGKVRG